MNTWRKIFDKTFPNAGRVMVFEDFIQTNGFGWNPRKQKNYIKEKSKEFKDQLNAMKEALAIWEKEFNKSN